MATQESVMRATPRVIPLLLVLILPVSISVAVAVPMARSPCPRAAPSRQKPQATRHEPEKATKY